MLQRFLVTLDVPDDLPREVTRHGLEDTLEMEFYISADVDPQKEYLRVKVESTKTAEQEQDVTVWP